METGFYPARGTPSQVQPTGHQPDGSGLQNHSVSGLYPQIIVYKPHSKTFEVSHRDGITRSANHRSYDAACAAALKLQELDALVGKRVELAHCEHTQAGTVQYISHGCNATVAVRFDTDDHDTHLPPKDLKVIA